MRKLFIILFIASTVTVNFKAQIKTGIHKMEYLKNFIPQNENISESDFPTNIIPLKTDVKKDLTKAIFGYLPYWEYPNSKSYLRYDLLTHIALFSFSVSSSGSISNPPGGQWPWTDVINTAHQNGVKVVMSVINFDITQQEMHAILTESSKKLNFINAVKSKINAYNLDGVNIDFEASNIATSDRGANINNFMKELTDSIHSLSPNLEVSYASPAVNWGGHWDLTGLAESCDYLFIMGYDFYGSWSDVTGPTAPLVSGSSYNITSTVDVQYSDVTQNYPDKLILGVPYFGPHWISTSDNEGSTTISFEGSERFRTAQPQSEIYGLKWSHTFKNSWYSYPDGNNFRQIWFDNDSSLSLKYDLAISRDLKGIGMWALGYDGARTELWNLIDKKFAGGETPPPGIPATLRVIAVDESTIKVEYEPSEYAESYEIYHSTDGDNFIFLEETTDNVVNFNNLETLKANYYKVRAKNSSGISFFTEVLGAVPATSKVLVVNGFDRIQNTSNTFDFVKYHSQPLINSGFGYSSCSNEAIFNEDLNLNNFEIVFWMLLDESTSDESFNQLEQEKIKNFLEYGGKLFVSGAEIGWDLIANGNSADSEFYTDYLKAEYISDAPNNQSGTYYGIQTLDGEIFAGVNDFFFDNGNHGTIDVDWPDAIKAAGGSRNVLKFDNVSSSSGYAGISYSGSFGGSFFQGKLVHFSFPYETIYDLGTRTQIINRVLEFFDQTVGVENKEKLNDSFALEQNYPNPFNPSTVIKYRIPSNNYNDLLKEHTTLKVYDLLGREIVTLVDKFQSPGEYNVKFDANTVGGGLPSGPYVYRLQSGNFTQTRKMLLVK